MKISQRDAENICIAMLQWRTMDGKLTTWGHDIQTEIVSSLTTFGRVTLELDDAPQIRQVQKDGLGKYLGTGARPAPREDGQEVRREEGAEDRRSNSPGQGAQVGWQGEEVGPWPGESGFGLAQVKREGKWLFQYPFDKTYYLAGPMSGYPDHNFPAFHRIAATLREAGYKIVNPAELNIDKPDRITCMKRDLYALLDCDGILLIKGWKRSGGARFEHTVARFLEYDVYKLPKLL